MLSVIAIGVFLGSLGFPVIFALAKGWRTPHRWSIHVKLTLVTTLILIVLGAVALVRAGVEQPEHARRAKIRSCAR